MHPPERDDRHVLLISVDGLHASDLSRWVAEHPESHLARLSHQGTTFTQAHSSQPSDSFPGLMALVTGGSPKTTGIFYDDSYARNMWAPGTNCAGAPGAEMQYFENLDRTDAAGLIPLFTSIDPANLPLAKVNGVCRGVTPHEFLLTNTIFNVADEAGLYTAWSDKHPAYDIVNGHNGDGVMDLFTPEINTSAVPDPTTVSVEATDAYDQIKVQAILNEIDGKTSDGKTGQVPAIFGMNFQSVSVGQKLVNPIKSCVRNPTPTCDKGYFPGGYQPGTLAFTPQMTTAMHYVDGAIGSMANELHARGLSKSTEIIVTAKHGQAPIDPSKLHKIGDQVSNVLSKANITLGQVTTDDVALVWLKDQHQTAAAVKALNADKLGPNTARIQTILSGDALADQFGDPLRNDRTPDIIVLPLPGTIYTGSAAKVTEHGGFSEDDTHVGLLVVNGSAEHEDRVESSLVSTRQVAPTILKFLGLEPEDLKSVRLEGTRTLPN
jgi:hypothetical protein